MINFLKDASLALLVLAIAIFTAFNLVYYNFGFGYALTFTQSIVAAFVILLALLFLVVVVLILKDVYNEE